MWGHSSTRPLSVQEKRQKRRERLKLRPGEQLPRLRKPKTRMFDQRAQPPRQPAGVRNGDSEDPLFAQRFSRCDCGEMITTHPSARIAHVKGAKHREAILGLAGPHSPPAGSLDAGTRVSVKFTNRSRRGFSWYDGTVTGPKGPNRYRISYDDGDDVTSLDPADEEYRVLPPAPKRARTAAPADSAAQPSESPAAVSTAPAAAASSSPVTPKKVARVAALLGRLPADTRTYAEREHWCDAKILAWLARDRSPNAFYYRFLPEGEEPRIGPWSDDEIRKLKQICLERGVHQPGSRPEWGIISQQLPGRVGYKCSAMYRRIVDGEEVPGPLPNYIDRLTGAVVRQPCISPEGYVAGHGAWHAALRQRQGRCPFTNGRLNPHSLILLTLDNIALYRHRIRNVDGDRELALSSVPFVPPPADDAPSVTPISSVLAPGPLVP
jgi:hypothetical protein